MILRLLYQDAYQRVNKYFFVRVLYNRMSVRRFTKRARNWLLRRNHNHGIVPDNDNMVVDPTNIEFIMVNPELLSNQTVDVVQADLVPSHPLEYTRIPSINGQLVVESIRPSRTQTRRILPNIREIARLLNPNRARVLATIPVNPRDNDNYLDYELERELSLHPQPRLPRSQLNQAELDELDNPDLQRAIAESFNSLNEHTRRRPASFRAPRAIGGKNKKTKRTAKKQNEEELNSNPKNKRNYFFLA